MFRSSYRADLEALRSRIPNYDYKGNQSDDVTLLPFYSYDGNKATSTSS